MARQAFLKRKQPTPIVLSKEESERLIEILEKDFAPTQAMLELNKKRHRDIVELV